MKKKIFSLALVVCCIAVMAFGGTMAFFTADDVATNVITSGKIDIDLVEKVVVNLETGETEVVEDFFVEDVMPGQEVSKIVLVENEQYAEDAWIRVNITKSIMLADGREGDASLLEIKSNTTDWTVREEADGTWYYYNKPLSAEEETVPLMENVVFSVKAGNEYQEAKAEIYVLAQAVQVKNNGATAWEAKGWPAIIGEE